MRNLWLVFKREYLIRVRKRTFILTTILIPLVFAGLMIGSAIVSTMSSQSDMQILVKDDSGILAAASPEHPNYTITYDDAPLDTLKEDFESEGYDMLVYIPPFDDLRRQNHRVMYYSSEKVAIVQIEQFENIIGEVFRTHKIAASNIDQALFDSFRTHIDMDTPAGEGESHQSGKVVAMLGTLLGLVMGVLMYMVLLIYGQLVMRSVMEEKISRISEVMLSSVKPFDLMMGKILGVGAVGLTQLAIWLIVIPVVLAIIPFFVELDAAVMSQAGAPGVQELEAMGNQGPGLAGVMHAIYGLSWWLIIPSFVLFFLGGYFVYSSVFAAIGSAVDEDLGEAQQFMLPVMAPIIFAFVLMMSTIQNPNGGIAVFGSIFPLFSPIIMPARLPFDPPMWQVVVSLLLLFGTTLFFVWLSARIYRVGILMYGKKVTFREMGRWLFYRG